MVQELELTAEQRFAEEMGQMFDIWSQPRMAGRVWGLLMVSDEAVLSSQDLAERLHASAGSISTATRFLTHNGLIQRIRQPGERREYFRFDPHSAQAIFQQRIDLVASMHRAFESAAPRFEDRPLAYERLRDLHDFYDWMEVELRELMAQWKRQHPGIPSTEKPNDRGA
jgi:DNA-binding transcriptional regulator GbsR (MarR family)